MKNCLIITVLLLAMGFGCSQDPESVDDLLKAGQDEFLAGEYRQARDLFYKALKEKPSHHDILYYMGLCYQREYMYDSALFFFKKVDLLYPGEREINQGIYQVGPHVQDYPNTIAAIRKLIKLGDAAEPYWAELADLFRRDGAMTNAYYYYRLLMERNPENVNHYMQVANTATFIDSQHVATRVIDSAIDRFGPSDRLLSNKATILSFVAKFKEAEIILRGLLEGDSLEFSYSLNLAGVLAEQESRAKREEALRIYKQLRLRPDNIVNLDSVITVLSEELDINK